MPSGRSTQQHSIYIKLPANMFSPIALLAMLWYGVVEHYPMLYMLRAGQSSAAV